MSTTELFEAPEARAIELYEWQTEAVDALRNNIRAGVRNQILSAPTGAGKTEIAGHMIEAALKKGTRAVFVVDRESLVNQTSERFDKHGIPHGVIQADHWRRQPWQKIQVASAQTLARRSWPDDLSLIFVDECHTIHRNVITRIAHRDTVTIGLTATPFTKGLGRFYDRVVTVRTTNQLIAEGRLAPFRVFAASEPDMEGAKVSAGEWTITEAEQRSIPIVGDIVTEYLRHGGEKKFIAFGATIKHCEEIHRQMMSAGVICDLYTSNTPDEARKELLREFARPTSYLRGLVSVAALAKGFDNAGVEVVIMARPLRSSLAEHIQILGRGLRSDPNNPGKVCTVLDHAGNCVRFWGAMQDFFENGAPPLDMGIKKEKKKPEKRDKEPYKCPKCAAVHMPRPECPACGHEYPRRSHIEHVAGELNELTGLPVGTREDKRDVYAQLLHIGRSRGYQPGWAKHKYRDRYGVWPVGMDGVTPKPPTLALRSWIRSQAIAYAKAKAAA